ncbi:MAG: FHA domain-containing protein, partial [Pseudomonadota bacterium]
MVINDSNVSRRHAEIRQEGNEYVIVDLDSTNGVEVNGQRVRKRTLRSGDVITLGATRVRFEHKTC